MQLPSGFPVKIEIPLFHLINARITFSNIQVTFILEKSIDINKSIGVTIYNCQIQAIIKKRKTFEVMPLFY